MSGHVYLRSASDTGPTRRVHRCLRPYERVLRQTAVKSWIVLFIKQGEEEGDSPVVKRFDIDETKGTKNRARWHADVMRDR